jgi:hypothetical protein
MSHNDATRMQRLGYRPPLEVAEPEQLVLEEYVSGGRVAIITLNRPHADNAITTELARQLIEILETIAGAVGNDLRHVRQHPCSAGRDGSGGCRQDALFSGHDVNDGEQDDGDDARWQEQMRQRRKYRGDGWRDLIENPEQVRIPAGRPRFDQQRRRTEEHYPKTSQEPGGPCRRNPGRAVRPPPRCGRDHGEQAAGAPAGCARHHRLATARTQGLSADTKTTATSNHGHLRQERRCSGRAGAMTDRGSDLAVPKAGRAGWRMAADQHVHSRQ